MSRKEREKSCDYRPHKTIFEIDKVRTDKDYEIAKMRHDVIVDIPSKIKRTNDRIQKILDEDEEIKGTLIEKSLEDLKRLMESFSADLDYLTRKNDELFIEYFGIRVFPPV